MPDSTPTSLADHDRNANVFKTLLGMGLSVIPIYDEIADGHRIIDHFIVSCGLPNVIKQNNYCQ